MWHALILLLSTCALPVVTTSLWTRSTWSRSTPARAFMTSTTWTSSGTTRPPSPGGTSCWRQTTSTTSTCRTRGIRRSSKPPRRRGCIRMDKLCHNQTEGLLLNDSALLWFESDFTFLCAFWGRAVVVFCQQLLVEIKPSTSSFWNPAVGHWIKDKCLLYILNVSALKHFLLSLMESGRHFEERWSCSVSLLGKKSGRVI